MRKSEGVNKINWIRSEYQVEDLIIEEQEKSNSYALVIDRRNLVSTCYDLLVVFSQSGQVKSTIDHLLKTRPLPVFVEPS